ncbi:uncharacterized protein CTHT_0073020 [Thermochaetoides thermophila DSM 1495]|uniref:ATP-dependent (S)-NAD(P)H-hydrate dehydratase n=1 Tax=Chaetomium thermophilum (strain DSM 1495 / CBS 144.50 / IMI 039719) TaxID=759272 RepID=G0SHQ7_CHATD|nr:hypothetical protein CTHT_0073020 [Thermochaetoides thermophila DSM 1495]EGS16977.1 hypothetical protein CTHT_0073020 [Thermochaetoides thermophila DSM 1495]
MSATTKDILSRVRMMIPPLLSKFHKGQLGRVAVIGGSEDYTGAPYFSAMASAKLGCDMSHVICTPTAAQVIKSYSPNLMVHPYMRSSPSPSSPSLTTDASTEPHSLASRIIAMLSRLHVLVIGPGLGRDPLMHDTCALVITAARERGMPIVLDADALLIVQNKPELVRGYKLAVLTPNVVEFDRVTKALGIEDDGTSETGRVEKLARALGGVTVLQKGKKDFLSDGEKTMVVDWEGGRKRSGGQGDTLTGLQASDLTDEVHNAFMNIFGEVDVDGDEGDETGGAARL